jgi:hypothetical protein
MTPALLANLDPFFVWANRGECVLWLTLAAVLLMKSRRTAPWAKPYARLSAVVLAAFGLSDVVESYTGAWWKPWWLLAWKAACIAAVLVLGSLAWRTHRRNARD